MLQIRIRENERTPALYRIAWYDYCCRRAVCYPLGIHWIAWAIRACWHWTYKQTWPDAWERACAERCGRAVVWVAMQVNNYIFDPLEPGEDPLEIPSWELIGVFTTEEKAVAACKEPTDCVAPIHLDAVAARETTVMQGAYYPLNKEQPD